MKTEPLTRRQFNTMLQAGTLLLGTFLAGAPSVLAQATNAPAKSAESAVSAAAKPSDADEHEYNNWLEFGVGGNSVSGDRAQFQRQKGLPAAMYGGIQSFHYEAPFQKKGLISIDTRGIFDNHDYSLTLEAKHPDKGYVRFGYREFRQYYDGTGGYLPSTGLIFNLYDPRFAVDRSDLFFEAGLTLPDKPVITFRYDREIRDGVKDSTSWGTTTLTPGALQKKIAPAYRELDETRDIFQADVSHTIRKTDLGLGVRFEFQHNNDRENITMQPRQGTASRLLTHQDVVNADLFNVHAFTDTRLNDKLEFTSGYSYMSLHSDFSGSRLDAPLGTSATDTRFVNLAGGSAMKQYQMNLNLMYTPSDNYYIVPAVRVSKEDLEGSSTDNPVSGVAVVGAPTRGANDEAALYVTESLDLRYVGITNWTFYARGEWSEDRANKKEFAGATFPIPTILYNTWHRLQQKYTLGANWYPLRRLNFALQYYHKTSDNEYDNAIPNPPLAYPGFIQDQQLEVDNMNFRVTWRPLTSLTLVSRYDFDYGTISTRGGLLAQVNSGRTTRHMLGETISWTPLNRVYVQLGGNYVLNDTHTPAEDLGGVLTGVILNARNDYWTANGMVGYALDEKTDVQAQYAYYRANDYFDNSTVGLPYGAGNEAHNIGATLARQITRNLRWTLRYGYATYRDQASGGNLNYQAHMLLTTFQYRF